MGTGAAVTPSPVSDLRTFIEKQSGQHIFDCYQCGKCSAGCPVDYAMDLGPRQIMRYISANAASEHLDGQGRVKLPNGLLAFAAISKDVTIIGVQDHVEIWDRATWAAYRKEMEEGADATADELALS